ncbi:MULTISPECIES: YdeI/OmpD-associated family protein [unclassified Variovorax]|uniref:YdeI/OmpD-associated family protein n=1 Tax=Variovorax sp. Sphag1AA TaxID=2587027 RepID=UPI0016135ED4
MIRNVSWGGNGTRLSAWFSTTIHDAKTQKTRLQRIQKFVAMLERGEMIHPGAA